jgi:hypothetical protein
MGFSIPLASWFRGPLRGVPVPSTPEAGRG